MPLAPSTMSDVTSSTEAKFVSALKNSWVKKISASRLSSSSLARSSASLPVCSLRSWLRILS